MELPGEFVTTVLKLSGSQSTRQELDLRERLGIAGSGVIACGLAVAASGHPVVRLSSGAGHDAVMLSAIAPIALLFVRCAGGISHNPAESVTVEDVAAAIDATTRFLERVG